MEDRTKSLLQAMLDRVKSHRMKSKSGGEEIQTAYPFMAPVDTAQFPDYLSIVQQPVDLGSIEKKLANDEYHSPDDFAADCRLMFTNCLKYNGTSGGDICLMAKKLRSTFDHMWCKFYDFLARPGKLGVQGEYPLALRAKGCASCNWRGCCKCDTPDSLSSTTPQPGATSAARGIKRRRSVSPSPSPPRPDSANESSKTAGASSPSAERVNERPRRERERSSKEKNDPRALLVAALKAQETERWREGKDRPAKDCPALPDLIAGATKALKNAIADAPKLSPKAAPAQPTVMHSKQFKAVPSELPAAARTKQQDVSSAEEIEGLCQTVPGSDQSPVPGMVSAGSVQQPRQESSKQLPKQGTSGEEGLLCNAGEASFAAEQVAQCLEGCCRSWHVQCMKLFVESVLFSPVSTVVTPIRPWADKTSRDLFLAHTDVVAYEEHELREASLQLARERLLRTQTRFEAAHATEAQLAIRQNELNQAQLARQLPHSLAAASFALCRELRAQCEGGGKSI